jgi:hypothetical protein
MKEINATSALTITKKNFIGSGVDEILECTAKRLINVIEDKFIDLVLSDLQEIDNAYQFILTIKRIDPE